MMGLSTPFRRLREAGILGINQRNVDYVMACNQRRDFPLVDDKRRTKALAEAAGIAVPGLIAVIDGGAAARRLAASVSARDDGFVLKPARGAGGNGIMVITGRVGDRFRRSNGRLVSLDDLSHHVANILSGMHSLGGLPDAVLIEERVRFDGRFKDIAPHGVPDIRTVVYRGVPVMAMMRLPTQESDGKANLHQGAVGLGIDLATGISIGAVWHDRRVATHPDTLAPVTGLKMPGWDSLLELAASCHELCGLGYLGVDVVLDEERGPLLLELNARPGLSVQMASGAGLLTRMGEVDRHRPLPRSAAGRAALARRLFAADVPEVDCAS